MFKPRLKGIFFTAFAHSSVLALATLDAAQAADIDPKTSSIFTSAPVAQVEPSDRWAGIYIGGGLDGMLRVTKVERGAGLADFDMGSFTVGPVIYGGYNFASSGNWLIGLEADASNVGGNRTRNDALLGAVETKGSFITSARVRAGYKMEKALIYGTGGLAMTDMRIVDPATAAGEIDLKIGVVGGLGAEVALSDEWSVRGEALVYRFSNDNIRLAAGNRKTETGHAAVRLGLTRSF
jgi:outer membrane immunogenic protein